MRDSASAERKADVCLSDVHLVPDILGHEVAGEDDLLRDGAIRPALRAA
ncbi:hypothetical protein ACWD4O_44035 [Streptomyces sp. NPDC002623]